MTWALVVMLCGRPCTPQYVQLFKTRAECVKTAEERNSSRTWYEYKLNYCVPVDGELK